MVCRCLGVRKPARKTACRRDLHRREQSFERFDFLLPRRGQSLTGIGLAALTGTMADEDETHREWFESCGETGVERPQTMRRGAEGFKDGLRSNRLPPIARTFTGRR